MRTRYWFSRKQEQLSIKSDIFGLAKFLGSGIIVPHRHTTNQIDGEVYTEKTSGEDVPNWDDAVLVKETQDDRLLRRSGKPREIRPQKDLRDGPGD